MIPTFIIILFIVVVLGYNKKNDIILDDFKIDENTNQMTLIILMTDTIGGARTISIKDNGKDKYITFYSTFPLMSKTAKDSFVIELNPECENIYFNRGNGDLSSTTKNYKGEKYGLVLKKNTTLNVWGVVK